MNKFLANIESGDYCKEDIIYLLNDEDSNALYERADSIRREYVGNAVHLRGIIEFSNYCRRSCLYCGLQKQNRKLERYRIEVDEIIDIAREAVSYGYRTIVLQSGEDEYYTDEMICRIVREIKKMGYALTLSIGEKNYNQYKKYKEAGADRYLLKHETADAELYSRLNPGMSLEKRIECQKNLKNLGYQVGSGIMVGLPGQTMKSIADDIILFDKMDYDMIGISPFIPHYNTVLKDEKIISSEVVKKITAITRIIMKDVLLPVTTAFATLNVKSGREEMLRVGANVIMPNITPVKYKVNYEIYPDKACLYEEAWQCKGCLAQRIKSEGRTVATDFGHRVKVKRGGKK